MRFLLAGGGTAGHVNPLLATAAALVRRGHEVEVLGTAEGLESDLVPAEGLRLHTMAKVPIPRRPSPQLFTVPSRLRGAVAAAEAAMAGCDAVIGFGGYVAAPAYLAAAKRGIPFLVQEQNVRPGWANRLGARNAQVVSLAFSQTRLHARRGETVFTGLPLRRSIMELAEMRRDPESLRTSRLEARRAFDLDPDLPVLLVTGGSLGAQHLNDVVAQGAGQFAGKAQIVHATGKGKAEPALQASAQLPEATWVVREYLDNMEVALAAADLVLCRSGAGTVSELGVLGMPAFYVPLPIGNGEQKLNAQQQVAAGGAQLVEDKDFTVETLLQRVLPLVQNAGQLAAMGAAIRGTSPGDGAELLADLAALAATPKE